MQKLLLQIIIIEKTLNRIGVYDKVKLKHGDVERNIDKGEIDVCFRVSSVLKTHFLIF